MSLRVALTVDVEDDWNTGSLRGIDEALPALLDDLDTRGIRATLFWVGTAAQQRPDRVRDAHARGHVIASHGMTHAPLSRCTSAQQRDELSVSRDALQAIVGAAVTGFRAPYFDLPRGLGATLASCGYRWSSSKAPFSPVARYRHLFAPRAPHPLDGADVREIPVPAMLGLPIPEGLSYRRLFAPLAALGPRPPRVFYLHPYELLDGADGFALPGYLRPFLGVGEGAAARRRLSHLLDRWRDAGVTFDTLSEHSS